VRITLREDPTSENQPAFLVYLNRRGKPVASVRPSVPHGYTVTVWARSVWHIAAASPNLARVAVLQALDVEAGGDGSLRGPDPDLASAQGKRDIAAVKSALAALDH